MTSGENDTFLLPEILVKVSKILNVKDLFNCILVNKSWYLLFLPALWRNITIKSMRTKLRPEYLEAHRQYVVKLEIEYQDPVKYSFHFPSLQQLLVWKLMGRSVDYKKEDSRLKILELNPTVETLDVSGAALRLSLADWNCIVAYPSLSKLIMLYDLNDYVGQETFWKIFRRLSVLHFLSIPSSEMSNPDPGVESFYSPSISDSKWFPSLQEIVVLANIQGMRLRIVVKDMNKVVVFRCRGSTFNPRIFRALQPQFNTLVEVQLACAGSIHSYIQEILCSAPNLQKYRGGTITANDIAYGRPWVCVLLSVLSVRICCGTAEVDLQPLVFKELSRLVHLKTLDIGFFDLFPDESDAQGEDLRFSLDCGMDQLSNLKMLEDIDADGTDQKLTEKDVEWMEKNLVSLKTFSGTKYTLSTSRIQFINA